MNVLEPTRITTAMLVSHSVAEDDYPPWNAGTDYTAGTRVIRADIHRIFENVIAGIDATLPENATSGLTPRWQDLGATNAWKMFDNAATTQTVGTSPLEVVLDPGFVSGLALLDVDGASEAQVVITDGPSGPEIFNQVIDMDGTIITSVYDWFFAPQRQLRQAVLLNLPPYNNPRVTVTLTGTGPKVGTLQIGVNNIVGKTKWSPRVGIQDYSGREKNPFGVTTLVVRDYARRMSANVIVDNDDLNAVYELFARVRGVPCVYIGSSIAKFGPLVVFGFYNSFDIEIPYAIESLCSLEVEGFTDLTT